MTKKLMNFCTVAAIAAATAGYAHAQEGQTDSGELSETVINPAPTLAEDIAYLRDVIAVQTLRLDSAEQSLQDQTEIIQSQTLVIAELKRRLGVVENTRLNVAREVSEGSYVVQLNDNLYSIAQEFGSSVEQMAKINNLSRPYILQVGQRLIVPARPGEQAPSVGTPPAVLAQENAIERNAQQSVDAKTSNEQAPAADQTPVRTASTNEAQPDNTTAQPSPEPQRVAQADTGEQPAPERSQEIEQVGVRPEDEDDRPYLAILSDVGGILTPKGSLFAEPAFDFTASSDNRFFFQGIEIIDAVLIGAIEATDSDRRAITESLGFRYGVTNRFEVDGRISYLQRNDRISGVAIDDGTTSLRDLNGSGFGDAEIGLHYQLNKGIKLPYTIANLRVKAPTGTGPFDIDRDPDTFIDTELATGSGFWTVEPSATFILSSDPAVIFANFGYQFNLPTSPNAQIGQSTVIQEFDPGDAIRASIGVGLSLNERMSLNFGYDQSFFFNTSSSLEITAADGSTFINESEQPSVTVGTFLFGGSYAVNDRLRFNLNAGIGATDEAPDARIGIRAQYRLFE